MTVCWFSVCVKRCLHRTHRLPLYPVPTRIRDRIAMPSSQRVDPWPIVFAFLLWLAVALADRLAEIAARLLCRWLGIDRIPDADHDPEEDRDGRTEDDTDDAGHNPAL